MRAPVARDGSGSAPEPDCRGETSSATRLRHDRWDAAFSLSVFAICAGGWLVRCFWIGRQSFWYDEAGSVALAALPVGQIFGAATLDIHPPLYFYLLHVWMLLAGQSEAALRLMSAIQSTLLVPVMALLGRRVGGRTCGIVAGALAALSPFFAYYGQETRMYALLALLSALAFYALARAVRGGARWWVVFVASASCALWTHLYGVLALAAADAWLALAFLIPHVAGRSSHVEREPAQESVPPQRPTATSGRRLDVIVSAAIANAVVVVTWLPWLPVAVSKVGTYASPDKGSSPGWILDQTLVVFALGHSVVGVTSFPGTPEFAAQESLAHALVAPFVACLILGAFLAARDRAGFALAWLVVPVLGAALVSSGTRDVNIRYLIEAAPAYVLLIGLAIAWLLARRRARPLGALALAAVLGASAASLHAMYADPTFARDDDRRAVAVIRARAAPGAGVVLDANFTPVFDYYAHGAWPAINEPREVPPDVAATGRELAAFVAGRPQVWAILWHDYYADPHGIVWTWLKQHLYARDYLNVRGGLKVLAFDAKPADATPAGGEFGGVAMVEAYSARLAPSRPAELASVDLYWRALGRPSADYSIAAHLVDSEGNVYGTSDSQPAGGDLPMTSWREGDLIHTIQPLRLEPWAAPGRYRVQVVVYDQASGASLPATGPEAEPSGLMLPVAITPGTSSQAGADNAPLPDAATRVDATFSNVAVLRGYQLGRSAAGNSLTLFWQAMGPAPVNYKVFVHVLDSSGNIAGSGDSNVAAGAADMTTWRPGERVRDVHRVALPPSGASTIEIGLYDPSSGARVDVRTERGLAPPDKALRLDVA